MNPTGATSESELILRRLADPIPFPGESVAALGSPAQQLVGFGIALLLVGLVALLAWRDYRGGLGWIWTAALSLVRLGSVLFFTATLVLPRVPSSGLTDFGWTVLAIAAALAGVAWVAGAFLRETRAIGWWSLLLVPVRGLALLLAVAVVAMPRMVLWSEENAGWVILTAAAVLAGFARVVSCYVRDARVAGWWAVPLALARTGVYLLVAGVFLLPAMQLWEHSEKRSRVVILIDISPSVTRTSDDVAGSGVRPRTRMQKLLDFLTDEQVGFLAKILEKNPVAVYRFGTRLDEESHVFANQPAWSKEDWAAWVGYDFKPWALRGLSPAGREAVRQTAAWKGDEPGTAEWAIAWARAAEADAIPAGLADSDRAALADARARLEKRVDVARSIVLGTNVADSLTAAVNREAPNLVQGLILFSDGRSNLGTDSAFRVLRERATREKIPIFTVAVGEARENIGIQITDVQAPDRAPPDEKFKIAVEADGLGLADAEVDVRLDLFLPGRDPKKDAADHTLTKKLRFAGDSTPPHGVAEFVLDPENEELPEELTEPSKKVGRRRQLKSGPWSVVARIARDKREVFSDPDHVSPPRVIQVIDRPLRVLLFGGPTREYQTLRTLLVRETQQNRAELSICLQTEGGREGTGVQDVPPERLLNRFPTRLDTTGKTGDKPEDKYYNLNEYDLIVAFDPDWSELSADQIKNLQSWVDNLGGGLIYVAGTHNTFQLARADETGRLKPLLDVLPVVPDDVILVKTRPVPRTPRRLLLRPNPEYDVLKLDESADEPTAGWETFFTGAQKYAPSENVRADLNPERGIFAYYPVKDIKPGASTLATFLDVKDTGEPDPKPWLVTTQPARGRTVFLASGEIWRLRPVSTDYYDRFWIKLGRYAAGNRDVRASRGRVLVNKEYSSGSQIRVQARLLAPNGAPYEMTAINPKFVIQQWNAAASEMIKPHGPFELRPRKGGGDFDGYYAGQVLADPARLPSGDYRYRVVVDVPDSPGDTITGEFVLKQSDPELDNTRPDFTALETAAGTLEEVRAKIKDPAVEDKLRGAERNPASVKLAFRLADTEKVSLIPACIDQTYAASRDRGAVVDLWDRPADLWGVKILAFDAFGRRIEIAWVLLAAVGLLGAEWLTRKLLRLA
jgi:hypothetical protein